MKKTLSKTGIPSSQKAEPESDDRTSQKVGPKTEIKHAEAKAAVQKAADQAQNDNAKPEGKRTSQSAQGKAQDQGKEAIQRAADQAQNEVAKSEQVGAAKLISPGRRRRPKEPRS